MHALPRENVAGHTKKVLLFQGALAGLRNERRSLRILDIGCGSGYAVTRYLGESVDDVLGIDLYEPNVAFATRKYARDGLRFECRSAESLVESKQRFDAIVLADVLEHLNNPASVLRECNRLLSAGGQLLITVPNGYGSFEIESAISRLRWVGPALLRLTDYFVALLNRIGPLRGKWTVALSEAPSDLPYNADSGHIQFFSLDRMSGLIRDAGFRIEEHENLSLFSGPFTNFLFGASQNFCRWNVNVARRVPARLAGGWFFRCSADGFSTPLPRRLSSEECQAEP